MSFAILSIVKATIVCASAFSLSRVCRRARASIRHLLFVLAFAALAAIPGAGPVLPTVAITVPATATVPAPRIDDMTSVLSSAGAGSSGFSTSSVPRETATTRSVTIVQVVTATWLIGVALFLIPVVVGFWQVRRLRESALPWSDGQALMQALASAAGVRRRIDVLLHDDVTGPITCGVFKPSIVLPESAQQWDEATLRPALRHELEHVARWDFLTHCLSRIVCASYWFHPLVWAAWRQLRLEAERACDDAVLREDDAGDYASLLVFIAKSQPAAKRQPLLAMAGRHDLAARVAAVLDDDRARGRVGGRRATGLIITGAVATLGVAAITVARTMPQTIGTGVPQLRFETASLKRSEGAGNSLMHFTEHADGKPGVGPDGRVQWLTAINVPARHLLWFAYSFELRSDGIGAPYQIDNVPEWVDSDHFDVVAKAPSRVTPQQMHEMMQSLMAERFKLVAHRGTKDFPIYALVLARPDGNPGPRLTSSHIDCRSKPGVSSPCGLSGMAGRLEGRGITMAQLVRLLPYHISGDPGRQVFDRPLIDRTRLKGRFDFTLQWIRDPIAPRSAARTGPSLYRPSAPQLESNAPNFLAALSEQLGLKFDNQPAPKPVLVVDKIEPLPH